MAYSLDPKFDYLNSPTMPRMIREGMKLHGIVEHYGAADNPVIVDWAKEINRGDVSWYNADSIPWCGLFVAVVAHRAGKDVVRNPLRAQAWKNFGKKTFDPSIGDVLVFERGRKGSGKGHVGFYVAETLNYFYVLGGNQSDMVKVSRISKERFLGAFRQYKIGRPASAVPHILHADTGRVSRNEA